MANLTVQKLKAYMGAGLNVAITGSHGVGKTAMLREAANQLGMTMKYYSASTLDPYTDLVGVPVPNKEEKIVEYYRPQEINDAEVVFFDEANRADDKTVNTIFEITQFHTINGEPLPKLKCVVIAMNPVSEEYATEELDHAFLDRFDVFLEAPAEISLGYFTSKFGDTVGKAAVELWKSYHRSYVDSQKRGSANNQIAYISPRRMEMITSAFVAIPSKETVEDCLPPEVRDVRATASNFYRKLNAALKETSPEYADDGVRGEVKSITDLPISAQRSAETGRRVISLIEKGDLTAKERGHLLNSLASALSTVSSPRVVLKNFGSAVKLMTATQLKVMTSSWNDEQQKIIQDFMKS